jgi:hypothetical protein
VTIDVEAPGVGLPESCSMSSCGPCFFFTGTFVGIGTITVAKVCSWFPASERITQLSLVGLLKVGYCRLSYVVVGWFTPGRLGYAKLGLSSVFRTVVRGPPVVCRDPQAVSEEEALQKLYQTLNE